MAFADHAQHLTETAGGTLWVADIIVVQIVHMEAA